MNCHSNVHWSKTGSNLSIDINLDKSCKIKGDLSNMVGKNIMKVFDKVFKKGHHRILKRIMKVDKGIYTMKISTDECSNVIRFIIE